jgi:hypothetical protein
LPDFLAAHARGGERPWLAELARLERARTEVFDGPDATPSSLAELRAVAPERFGDVRLRLIPAHRVLVNRFTIAPIWRASEPEPEEDASATDAPLATPETLIVWRRDDAVLHRAADADEARWLPRLAERDGLMFADLCAALGETRSDEDAAARAFELCARWVGEGLIQSS